MLTFYFEHFVVQTCFPWSQKLTQSQTLRDVEQVHTGPHPQHVDTQELKEGQTTNS
jgi:hypothetical protein